MHRICLISYQVKDYKVTYLCFTFCLQECQCSLSVKSVPSPYCAPQNYCECPNLPFYNLKTVFSLKFGLSNCHSILSSFFIIPPSILSFYVIEIQTSSLIYWFFLTHLNIVLSSSFGRSYYGANQEGLQFAVITDHELLLSLNSLLKFMFLNYTGY